MRSKDATDNDSASAIRTTSAYNERGQRDRCECRGSGGTGRGTGRGYRVEGRIGVGDSTVTTAQACWQRPRSNLPLVLWHRARASSATPAPSGEVSCMLTVRPLRGDLSTGPSFGCITRPKRREPNPKQAVPVPFPLVVRGGSWVPARGTRRVRLGYGGTACLCLCWSGGLCGYGSLVIWVPLGGTGLGTAWPCG